VHTCIVGELGYAVCERVLAVKAQTNLSVNPKNRNRRQSQEQFPPPCLHTLNIQQAGK